MKNIIFNKNFDDWVNILLASGKCEKSDRIPDETHFEVF